MAPIARDAPAKTTQALEEHMARGRKEVGTRQDGTGLTAGREGRGPAVSKPAGRPRVA